MTIPSVTGRYENPARLVRENKAPGACGFLALIAGADRTDSAATFGKIRRLPYPMNASTDLNPLSLVIGVLIVALFAKRLFDEGEYDLGLHDEDDPLMQDHDYLRFKVPYMTPKARYRLWSRTFVSAVVGIYLLLTWVLSTEEVSGAIEGLPQGTEVFAPLLKEHAVLVALLLTGVVPSAPLLKDLVIKIRDRMHKAARIPQQIRETLRVLHREIVIDAKLAEKCASRSNGLFTADIFTSTRESPALWLAKASYVMTYLQENLLSSERYRHSQELFTRDISRTSTEITQLIERAKISASSSPEGHTFLTRMSRRLYGRSLNLLVVLVFASEREESAGLRRLAFFNPAVSERPKIQLPVAEYAAVVLMASVMVLLTLFASHAMADSTLTQEGMKKAIRGSAIYFLLTAIPTLGVTLAKQRWHVLWPYRLPGQPRRVFAYLLAGVAGLACGLAVLFTAQYWEIAGFNSTLGMSILSFSLCSAAMAVITALCVDAARDRWFDLPRTIRHWRTGLFSMQAGVIMTGLTFIASIIAFAWGNQPPENSRTLLSLFTKSAVATVPATMIQAWWLYLIAKRRLRFGSAIDIAHHVLQFNDGASSWAPQKLDELKIQLEAHRDDLPEHSVRYLESEHLLVRREYSYRSVSVNLHADASPEPLHAVRSVLTANLR